MKKLYEKPEIEINIFEVEEITASGQDVEETNCICF
ncbi:hypothetical protein EUCA11A_08710 [Eubacterium callanderi]|nr:hypothetical protein EUCA2A_08710 [Eubacterium callanderi]WPK71018.1 hypothetical protein EUCA11A_08710 [Eubacterium callanderi]